MLEASEFEIRKGLKGGAIGLQPYHQYRIDDVVVGVFQTLKDFALTYLYDTLKEGFSQQLWQYEGDNEYLQYYIESIYGLPRSFGSPFVTKKYDTGETYDSDLEYDTTDFNGFMGLPFYKKLVKWVINYQYNSINLIWLYSFVADFCNTSNISFSWSGATTIINVEDSTESRQLQLIFSNREIYGFLPLAPIQFNLTTPTQP